ncbi:hypothetical protein THAOC_00365 [Thalassiosira oceanica]|uniref:Uncharacterized protein n=1 Tax=Thalassiosira oceanica TaxID=159749 RepID=K0TPB1_THAOC|nr:hypothetical protein THAOC_00365 [Thalassiosira oceanica]|eukprot:EJK77781.1 hypothetical protein THAOC_00365 [Thalassiosira oceanica]
MTLFIIEFDQKIGELTVIQSQKPTSSPSHTPSKSKECTMARFEGTYEYGDGGDCRKNFLVDIKCTSETQCVYQERSLDGKAHWETCESFDPRNYLENAGGRCSLGAQNGIALRENGTSGCVVKYHFYAIAKDASRDASANALDIHFSSDGGATWYTEEPGDAPRDAQPHDAIGWARRVQACENKEEVGRQSNEEEGKRGKAKTGKGEKGQGR